MVFCIRFLSLSMLACFCGLCVVWCVSELHSSYAQQQSILWMYCLSFHKWIDFWITLVSGC